MSKPLKVMLSMADELLERIDRAVDERGASRSAFLQEAAPRELGWPDPEAIDAALERGRAVLAGAGSFEAAIADSRRAGAFIRGDWQPIVGGFELDEGAKRGDGEQSSCQTTCFEPRHGRLQIARWESAWLPRTLLLVARSGEAVDRGNDARPAGQSEWS